MVSAGFTLNRHDQKRTKRRRSLSETHHYRTTDGNPELLSTIRRDVVNWANSYSKLVFSPHVYAPLSYTHQHVNPNLPVDPFNPIQHPEVYTPVATHNHKKKLSSGAFKPSRLSRQTLANDLKRLKIAASSHLHRRVQRASGHQVQPLTWQMQ